MSQNDFVIDNQTTPLFRADLNNALQALASNSSGPTEPATRYANQWWYDESTDILKFRSEANDAWINVGTFNQSTNTFSPFVLKATTSEAEAGTGAGLMDPVLTKAAINAQVPLKKQYQSSALTPTAGGLITVNHGLGEQPKIIRAYIEITTATGGYTSGQRVDVTALMAPQSNISRASGFTVRFDNTQILVRVGAVGDLLIGNGGTGASVQIPAANYQLYIEAWA